MWSLAQSVTMSGQYNIGESEHDFRVPDGALHRSPPEQPSNLQPPRVKVQFRNRRTDRGDTIVSIGDTEVRAAGGQGGLAGTGVRRTDGWLRLSVSALMLVNYAEVRDGLASIVGGGWQNYSVLNLPTAVHVPRLCPLRGSWC